MIITAKVDLSESGRVPLPEGPVEVLVYAAEDSLDLDAALAAIGRVRLIREGHVFSTTIEHALSAWIVRDYYRWVVDESGEVVPQ